MVNIKNMLLGNALANDQLKHEKLSRLWGLPIMASDAVSSVAYAVEEILLTLVPFLGLLAVQYVGMISVPIIILLLMLIFSYAQIINHYPDGGGAYAVSKENFGRAPSLLAASCLIVDYILTVAVSIASSTAAIVSAFPALAAHRVLLSLFCISLITLINLRGISESSKVFGVPTYLFIIAMTLMILTGFYRIMTGTLAPMSYDLTQDGLPKVTLSGITLMLFLHAFSSGCSALTGVEAVSNAVPSFREPSTKTARHVLYMLGAVIIFIFGGTCFLASRLKVLPVPGVTVMSQMAKAVFGGGLMYFFLQFTTAFILLLAANTAYNGLPILLAIMAKDSFVPAQFAHRGAKLSFSNGILFIYIFAGLLLIASGADTHALIPFYAVGVLVSFTISQFGMFVKWIKLKESGWQYKCVINGVGALVTFIGSIIVFAMKFIDGAWVLIIAIPVIMSFMSFTRRHYDQFGSAISVAGYAYQYKESKSMNKLPCVVLIHKMSRATLKTFDYAKDISSDITAVHISASQEETDTLVRQWTDLKIAVPLTVIPTPYRDIIRPLNQYIDERESKLAYGQTLTVVLTKFTGSSWRDNLFHNQTAFFIENRLATHKYVTTVLVPYVYDISY